MAAFYDQGLQATKTLDLDLQLHVKIGFLS